MKDKILYEQKQHVIYRLTCADCGGKYIDEMKKCLLTIAHKQTYSQCCVMQ